MSVCKIKSAIYSITNLITLKFYIGSAVNYKRRWSLHVRDLNTKTHSNSKLQRAWDKYGSENFEFKVIEYVQDKLNLLEIEQKYLDCLEAVDKGYNICRIAGSCLGVKRNAQALKNLKASHTPEVREKRAAKLRGFKHSDESRAAMKEAQNREETRVKRVASLTGRKMSADAVHKSSIGRVGQKRSDESRILMADKASKFTYAQYTTTGDFVHLWVSARDLREAGYDYVQISKVCNGKAKHHKGFIWKKLPKNPLANNLKQCIMVRH